VEIRVGSVQETWEGDDLEKNTHGGRGKKKYKGRLGPKYRKGRERGPIVGKRVGKAGKWGDAPGNDIKKEYVTGGSAPVTREKGEDCRR